MGCRSYSDGTLVIQLGVTLPILVGARNELLARDLITHETRFTQVLSLLLPRQCHPTELSQGLMQLGDILRKGIAALHPRQEGGSP
jgi:hypothetical protein